MCNVTIFVLKITYIAQNKRLHHAQSMKYVPFVRTKEKKRHKKAVD